MQGAPQYLHKILLDVLAKIKQYGKYAIFCTCLVAGFE